MLGQGASEPISGTLQATAAKPAAEPAGPAPPSSRTAATGLAVSEHADLMPHSQQMKAQPKPPRQTAATSAEATNTSGLSRSTLAQLEHSSATAVQSGKNQQTVSQAQAEDAQRPAKRRQLTSEAAVAAGQDAGSAAACSSQALAPRRHEARRASAPDTQAAQADPASSKARRTKAAAAASKSAVAAAHAASHGLSMPMPLSAALPVTAAAHEAAAVQHMPAGENMPMPLPVLPLPAANTVATSASMATSSGLATADRMHAETPFQAVSNQKVGSHGTAQAGPHHHGGLHCGRS